MKLAKRITLMSAVIMLPVISFSVSVYAKYEVPSKVRIITNKYQLASERIELTLNPGEYIKLTSSKGLYSCRIINQRWAINSNLADVTDTSVVLSVMTKKNGTYTIKFDIYDGDTGKRKGSDSIKVFAYSDTPVKSVLINGKKGSLFKQPTKDSTASVKVMLNSGYDLKKIEYGIVGKTKTTSKETNDYSTETSKNGKIIFKSFKNGGKIKLGTLPTPYDEIYIEDHFINSNQSSKSYQYILPYTYVWTTDDSKEILDSANLALTIIRATYIDKYTHMETKSDVYHIYKKL